jgi:hypothetical protein
MAATFEVSMAASRPAVVAGPLAKIDCTSDGIGPSTSFDSAGIRRQTAGRIPPVGRPPAGRSVFCVPVCGTCSWPALPAVTVVAADAAL